ncbi:hypothetical protein ACHAWF_014629, partial [Thalassiosira exigua]
TVERSAREVYKAQVHPAGPPPTMATSHSITSMRRRVADGRARLDGPRQGARARLSWMEAGGDDVLRRGVVKAEVVDGTTADDSSAEVAARARRILVIVAVRLTFARAVCA